VFWVINMSVLPIHLYHPRGGQMVYRVPSTPPLSRLAYDSNKQIWPGFFLRHTDPSCTRKRRVAFSSLLRWLADRHTLMMHEGPCPPQVEQRGQQGTRYLGCQYRVDIGARGELTWAKLVEERVRDLEHHDFQCSLRWSVNHLSDATNSAQHTMSP
jgi:hypothetical protein